MNIEPLLQQIAGMSHGMMFLFMMLLVLAPFPQETILSVLVGLQNSQEQYNLLVLLSFASVLGEIIWQFFLFYVAKNNLYKLKLKKHTTLPLNHWIHKYGLILYLIVPSISVLVPYSTEAVVIISGHRGVRFDRIFPFLATGIVIRGIITFMTIKAVLGI